MFSIQTSFMAWMTLQSGKLFGYVARSCSCRDTFACLRTLLLDCVVCGVFLARALISFIPPTHPTPHTPDSGASMALEWQSESSPSCQTSATLRSLFALSSTGPESDRCTPTSWGFSVASTTPFWSERYAKCIRARRPAFCSANSSTRFLHGNGLCR